MDFEEELFNLYKLDSEEERQSFITDHGYNNESEMSRSDMSFYQINRANTTKGALRKFHDRLNCGGYAFEIATRLYPPKDYNLSKYISSILENFSFIRLLGNSKLQDDEYIVIYRLSDNFGHHFIKVNNDGLVTEKNGYGKPQIFNKWPSQYANSSEVLFAVKKDHNHHCDSSLNLNNGLNFNETVLESICSRNNSFCYHSKIYNLKKAPSGEIVVVGDDSIIVATVTKDSESISARIISDKENFVENLSGSIKPRIENGRLINLDSFRGITNDKIR